MTEKEKIELYEREIERLKMEVASLQMQLDAERTNKNLEKIVALLDGAS